MCDIIVLTFRVSTLYNQEQSPLLRLPPEIRNTIYKYVLVGCTIWIIPPEEGTYIIPRCFEVPHYAALHYTSRQLCSETGWMHISQNAVKFWPCHMTDQTRVLLCHPIMHHVTTVEILIMGFYIKQKGPVEQAIFHDGLPADTQTFGDVPGS